MKYSFSEEQIQLRDTVSRFLEQHSTTPEIRRLMDTDSGFDRNVWSRLHHDLGIGGICVSEDYGGANLSFSDLAVVVEEMGRHLFCSPYLSSNVFGVTCIDGFGTEEQKRSLLPDLIAGEKIATVALCESNGGASLGDVATTAQNSTLNGNKKFVTDGLNADLLIIPAREVNGSDSSTYSLYVVDVDSQGVHQCALKSLDPTRKLTEVRLESAPGTRLGDESISADVYRDFLDRLVTALANEMVGGAQQMLDSAVAYAQERVQFGRSIGSLQAIKHKCAELLLEVEFAKSAAYRAAGAVDDDDPELSEYASIAKAAANDAYVKAASECIQIHGGIGFTWENDTHLWFKRAKSSQVFLGSSEFHRERLLEMWDA